MSENQDDLDNLSKDDIDAILRLPWRPFKSMSEARDEAIDRAARRLDLHAYHIFPGDKDRPEEWPEDRIQSAVKGLYANGHFFSIHLHGGIDAILLAVRQWLPEWNVKQPDWPALERVLVDRYEIDPLTLPTLTLLDIRRILSAKISRSASGKAKGQRKAAKQPKQVYTFTKREAQVYNAVIYDRLTYEQIAKQLGVSKQRVGALYLRAKAKKEAMSQMPSRLPKSKAALSGPNILRNLEANDAGDE